MFSIDVAPVLHEDPELGERLPPSEFAAARDALRVGIVTVEPGPWRPEERWTEADHPALGVLVLGGVMTRQIAVADRPSTELLGTGDLLRPWDLDADVGIPVQVSWRALERTRLAVLDERFLATAARWPQVVDALASRGQRRSRWLAFQLATKQIMRVEGRLLVLLWALSERWGHVTPHGVHVRLRLTHEALGKLVGARRPSVTTALGQLAAEGLLERVREGYVLHGDAETAVRRVVGGAADEPAAA